MSAGKEYLTPEEEAAKAALDREIEEIAARAAREETLPPVIVERTLHFGESSLSSNAGRDSLSMPPGLSLGDLGSTNGSRGTPPDTRKLVSTANQEEDPPRRKCYGIQSGPLGRGGTSNESAAPTLHTVGHAPIEEIDDQVRLTSVETQSVHAVADTLKLRGDGAVERRNKVVNRHLTYALFDSNVESFWSDALPIVQRTINSQGAEQLETTVSRGLIQVMIVNCYIDDIAIVASSDEEYTERRRELLERFRQYIY